MPLAYKPHSATVTPRTAVTVSSETTGYTDSLTSTVMGQMTEKTPLFAAENFGIDLDFPAVWLCNLTDAGSIKVGDKLTVNSRDYRVEAGPKRMDAEPITAHAMYLCKRFDD